MFVEYNANPDKQVVGDCVIRAISKATDTPWELIYADLCVQGLIMKDLPSSNEVWTTYLLENGFKRFELQNSCPKCYTIFRFSEDNPYGEFVVGTGTHAVAVVDGDYYDTWDSGDEGILYAFKRIGGNRNA